MRVFAGKIEKLEEISIDRFDETDQKCVAYFLSDYREEYLKGLSRRFFAMLKKRKNAFVYASELTCKMLEHKFVLDYEAKIYLRPVSPFTRVKIPITDEVITVIPIPSNSWTRSLMFLIEENEYLPISALYTGHYRVSVDEIKNNWNNIFENRRVGVIYLDVSYFSKNNSCFPTKERSVEEVCRIITGIVEKDKNASICLLPASMHGFENFFEQIYTKFKVRIFLDRNLYKEHYRFISKIDKYISNLPPRELYPQIHFCLQEDCPERTNSHKIKIMNFWDEHPTKSGEFSMFDEESDTHFVFYSTCASYDETKQFLGYLKPYQVIPCTTNENVEIDEVNSIISEILDELSKKRKHDDDVGSSNIKKEPSDKNIIFLKRAKQAILSNVTHNKVS